MYFENLKIMNIAELLEPSSGFQMKIKPGIITLFSYQPKSENAWSDKQEEHTLIFGRDDFIVFAHEKV